MPKQDHVTLTDGKTVFEVPQQYVEVILASAPELKRAPVGLDENEVSSVGGVSHGHVSNFPIKNTVARPRGQK